MRVLELEQGSDAWKQARAGCVTASRIADVLAKIKSGEAAARRDYKTELAVEILTGRPYDDGYMNAEMQWGLDQEPIARSAYEMAKDILVEQPGFVLHPTIDRAGASPDGVAAKIGLEIKSPKTATHLQYLLDGVVPPKYAPQMTWQIACMEAEACDFVSFDPRLPPHLQLFIVRFQRDDQRIREITAEVVVFLREVDELVGKLNRKAA